MSGQGVTRPRALVFDWDNTLVDSWQVIHAANNATFRAMGMPEWSLAETKSRVARSLRDAFPVLFGERWEAARELYYRNFEAIHLEYLKPLPGAEAALAGFARAGHRMAVVSNKSGGFLRKEVAHLGWGKWFDHVVGANDALADKPAAAPLLMALEPTGIVAGEEVWMIGDAGVDLECAGNAGCVPVLVRAEPPGAGEFPLHPPRHHVTDFDALAALVHGFGNPIS